MSNSKAQPLTLDQCGDVLTVEELAQVLRICRARGFEMVRTGIIKSVKCGRRILVPKAAIRRFLDG